MTGVDAEKMSARLHELRTASVDGPAPATGVERWIAGLQRRTDAPLVALWLFCDRGLERCAVVAEDEATERFELPEDSTLVEPVQIESEVLGYVALVVRRGHAPSQEDRDALRETATVVATELALARAKRDAKRAEQLVLSHAAVHDLIARAAPLEKVLSAVAEGIERHDPTVLVCIVLLDPTTGTMHPGAGPSLPDSYLEAIDGVVIGPNVGSCGTAAWSGELVISEDISTDPRWAVIREVPERAGLASCWSMPVKSPEGDVLGTLAFYGRSPRRPHPEHLGLLRDWARVVGIAIERHRAHERLLHDARHDPLTGLVNRIGLMEALEEVAQQSRHDAPSAVLFVDIDGLKRLNDTLGHGRADQVLREVGVRLSDNVPRGSLVGRIGGDEFLVVAKGVGRPDAEALATRLLEAIARPIAQAEAHVVTASIGVALASDVDTDASELLREADNAMYAAKRAGRDRCAFYDGGQRVRSGRRVSLRRELRRAELRDVVSILYEPVIDLLTRDVVGVEAVPHWRSATVGDVSARELWKIAEEIDAAAQLGARVLRESCEAVGELSSQLGRAVDLGVDVSVTQLEHEGFVHAVHQVLVHSRCSPTQLWLELHEPDVPRLGSAAVRAISDLVGLGVHIVLDHAGGALRLPLGIEDLPISAVKVDQRLIGAVGGDPRKEIAAAAVVSVARAYGCLVGALGIDAEDQRTRCAALGFQVGQGELAGRPILGGGLPDAFGAAVAR